MATCIADDDGSTNIAIKRCKSSWYRRMEELKALYGYGDILVHLIVRGEPRLSLFNSSVEKRVTSTARNRLQENMTNCKKRSLITYRTHTSLPGRNACVYSNDRGSSLLALARAGMLLTRNFRRHFEPAI